jgi:hypothetical protein
LENFPTLEALEVRRGMDNVQEDLISILEICPLSASDPGTRIQAVLRLLQREANDLHVASAEYQATLFAQQIRNRAVLLGIDALQSSAEQKLSVLGRTHFRLLWKTSRESPQDLATAELRRFDGVVES